MKAIRIAVVAGVLVGLVAATVNAGLFNANITGKTTKLVSGTVTTKSFSSKDIISLVTTSKTAKLVIDSATDALQVVDKCGNVLTNVLTELSTTLLVGPDASSNSVAFVQVSYAGSGITNGTAVVTLSDDKSFKKTSVFQIDAGNGKVITGKITTSSAFKKAAGCP